MQVHIIGGGVIGLFTAWYLREAGCEVTVIDRSDLTDGCSYGNAGMIVAGEFIPLAAPGVIAKGLRWMFDSRSPFYIKPRLDLDLTRWLWQFYRSCSVEKVNRAMPFLRDFNNWGKLLYREMAALDEFDFCYEEKGLLYLFRTAKAQRAQEETVDQAQSLGVEARFLSAAEVQQLEPGIRLDVLGGVYYPNDAHLYPDRLMEQLLSILRQKGVRFLAQREVTGLRAENGKIRKLALHNGEHLEVEQVVLAGGSWSDRLLRQLKLKMLMQDGKGYSFTLKNADLRPGIPTLFAEAKVAVTPMGPDLRIGGTLEISNHDPVIHRSRLEGILASIPAYYPELKVDMPALETVWHGYRPCTPDGLPYIGRYPSVKNLTIATGHAMMGITQGPATGKLVAELLTDSKTTLDIDLLAPGRF